MSTINFVAHGLVEAQPIKFANVIPDDTGIDETVTYYVIASGLTADAFKFSEVPGGSEFVFTSNITSGDVISPEEYNVLGAEEEPDALTGWATFRDIEPPAIPSSLTIDAAVKGAFVKWSPTTANDLAFYELRYAPDDGTGTGPETDEWTTIRVKTTAAYLGGLTADSNSDGFADARYWVQVRAVDTTGNVAPWQADSVTAVAATDIITTPSTHLFVEGDVVRFGKDLNGLLDETSYYVIAASLTTTTLKVSLTLGGSAVDITSDIAASDALTVFGYPTYRDYSQEAEVGWCIAVSVDPLLVGDDTIEYQSIGTEHVKVTGLSADVIKTGTLDINTTDDDMTDGIKVYDDGVLIGLWTEDGLYIYDNTDSDDYIRLFDGGLSVFLDGVETAAITPEGVNASALFFGSMPGGHNVILNSGFELAAFGTGATSVTWTLQADFDGTDVSTSNLTHNAGSISATTLAY